MNKRQFDIMDILNILSFCIGLQNLDENLSQDSVGNMLKDVVEAIHSHLAEQDKKIDMIWEVLNNDKNKKDG